MAGNFAVVGCGDIGRRLVAALLHLGVTPDKILASVNTQASASHAMALGLQPIMLDLDDAVPAHLELDARQVFYTVPPPASGAIDARTKLLLRHLKQTQQLPSKVILLSTTGVYGDTQGGWVNEMSPVQPTTERAVRRLDSEQQWLAFGEALAIPVVVLRVPGIYARSRLPVARLAQRTPVVVARECGFSNRIHADDLVTVMLAAMQLGEPGEVFNASDGKPSKISEYLQAAAAELGQPPLPEISLAQAQSELSERMLSYLRESRRIDNRKMRAKLKVTLRYPDLLEGIKYG